MSLRPETVAKSGVRVDEAPARQRRFQLHAELVHVYVDRAISWSELSSPHRGGELLPGNDLVGAAGKLGKHAQFDQRQGERVAVDSRQVLLGHNHERSCGKYLVLARRESRHTRMLRPCYPEEVNKW
jgi:hypothetical protein